MANEPNEPIEPVEPTKTAKTKELPTKAYLIALASSHANIVDVLTEIMLSRYVCRVELVTKAVHYCRVAKITTSNLVVLVDAHPLGTRVTYTTSGDIASVTIDPSDQAGEPGIQTDDGQVLYEVK